MSHRSAVRSAADPPVPSTDRRVAPRLPAEAVPWITTVKPNMGDTAQLIDISKTGVLIETRTRLLPGRRNTLILSGPDKKAQRIDGKVVRTQLVSITPADGPLYRTALTFTKELELNLPNATGPAREAAPDVSESVAEELDATADAVKEEEMVERDPSHPRLDGPFEAMWVTEAGSDVVEVSNITETGCSVDMSMLVSVDDLASISVQFSHVRRLLLTGEVAAVTPTGCVFRFSNLTPEQRRALRIEIRGRAASRTGKGKAAPQTLPRIHAKKPGVVMVESFKALPSFVQGLQSNEW